VEGAEADGSRDAEGTAKAPVVFGNLLGGLGNTLENVTRPLEEPSPFIGERHPARAPLQEARPKRALQSGKPLADNRFGEAQASRCFAEGAGVCHRHEGADSLELHHCSEFPEASFEFSRPAHR